MSLISNTFCISVVIVFSYLVIRYICYKLKNDRYSSLSKGIFYFGLGIVSAVSAIQNIQVTIVLAILVAAISFMEGIDNIFRFVESGGFKNRSFVYAHKETHG